MKIWILTGAASGDPDVYPGQTVSANETPEWQVSDGLWDRSKSYDAIDPMKVAANVELARSWAKPGEEIEVVFASEGERDYFWSAMFERLSGCPVADLTRPVTSLHEGLTDSNGIPLVQAGWVKEPAPDCDDVMTP